MTLKTVNAYVLLSSALLMLAAFQSGCGEDPSLYQEESLNFESGRQAEGLDLGADESSDFQNYYGFYAAPYDPWPLYDYYLKPLPVAVPINPFFNLIDWVHPMYIDQFLSGDFGRGNR